MGSVSDCSSAPSRVFLTKDQQQQLASYKEQGTAASINTLWSSKGFPFHFLAQLAHGRGHSALISLAPGQLLQHVQPVGLQPLPLHALMGSPCSTPLPFSLSSPKKGCSMLSQAEPGHAVDGLQTLQRVTLPGQDLVGPGCRWEPRVVILSSDSIPFPPTAVLNLQPLGRGFHLSNTPETCPPRAFGLVHDHPGETPSEPAKGM